MSKFYYRWSINVKIYLKILGFVYFLDTQEAKANVSPNSSSRNGKKGMMDLVLITSPFSAYSCLLVYPVFYFLDLDIPMLAISSFPANFRNPVTITSCILVEMFSMFLLMNWVMYFIFAVVSFNMTFIDWIKREIKEILEG